MDVQCHREESLQFLRLLSREDFNELRENTCWQQIEMIAPKFEESTLLTEVRLLFETYLDYILKSSDEDMTEMEEQLNRLEGMLRLKKKLRLVYRPIVERLIENKEEIRRILQVLRQLREAKEGEERRGPARSRKTKKGNKCCQSGTSMAQT